MDPRGQPSMMGKMADEQRPYDLLLVQNMQDGSVRQIVNVEEVGNPPLFPYAEGEVNVRGTMLGNYGLFDGSSEPFWRPRIPAPVLSQNLIYGASELSDTFAGGDLNFNQVYEPCPPQVPPRMPFVDVPQPIEQNQSQFGGWIHPYGQVTHQGIMPCSQPIQAASENLFPPTQFRMQDPTTSRYFPLQQNPSPELAINQQQQFIQQGPVRPPFQTLPTTPHQNITYFQSSLFRAPLPNVHQPSPIMPPTIPSQMRFPYSSQQSSAQLTPNLPFQSPWNMGMFPQDHANYQIPRPQVFFDQQQKFDQDNSQAYKSIEPIKARFEALDPAPASPTIYQPNISALNERSPGTRRRGSRATFKVLQHRESMSRDPRVPIGKSRSLDRSCEPVVLPKEYENVEQALAALKIGGSQQAERPRHMNAGAVPRISDEKSKTKGYMQTNDVLPNAGARSSRPYCELCKSNKEPEGFYTSHSLKDRMGRVQCPVLRKLVCSLCGATGDTAHTRKYCPLLDFGTDNMKDIEMHLESEDESGEGEIAGAGYARYPASQNLQYEKNHNAAGRSVTKKF